MSVLLVILTSVGAITLMVLKALAVDQARGHLQRYFRANLEATIATLPEELQAEWAEEWRADLAMQISMPATAFQFVRGVRRSARELVREPALVCIGLGNHPPAPSNRGVGWGVVLPRGQVLLTRMNLDLHRRFWLYVGIFVALLISAAVVWRVAEIFAAVLIGLAMLAAVVSVITYIRIKLDL